MTDRTSEPWVPEPPQGPRYEARTLPLCPDCMGLARRDILALTAEGTRYGPWRCDLHGEIKRVVYEELDVPTGYEEDAYDLNDPKHPRHHEVHADAADLAD